MRISTYRKFHKGGEEPITLGSIALTFKSGPVKYFFFFVLLMLAIVACNKDDDFGEITPDSPGYKPGNGVFIINEGNFGNGNGSLSFLNLDSLSMYNNIFYHANQRPLGDVPQTMTISGDTAWIVVNNSGKVEVVDLTNMSSISTIGGFQSPRFFLSVTNQKAYVSDFVDEGIFVVNKQNFSIEGKVSLGCSSEQMLLAEGKVFVAFWSNYGFSHLENNKLMVIDADSDQVIDSVFVGKEPNSLVLDNEEKLWVLCSGGFAAEEKPSLWRIDPINHEIITSLIFPDINNSPTSLCANGRGDTLYFLNQGVFRLAIDSQQLPDEPIITEDEHLFYTLGINPITSEIFTSDAIDYQQRGLILRYRPDGDFIDSFRAGIIPGRFVF